MDKETEANLTNPANLTKMANLGINASKAGADLRAKIKKETCVCCNGTGICYECGGDISPCMNCNGTGTLVYLKERGFNE